MSRSSSKSSSGAKWCVSQARLSPDGTHVVCNAEHRGLQYTTLHAVAADGTVGDAPVHAMQGCDFRSVFWRRVGGSWELMLHVPPRSGSSHRVVRCADGSVATTFSQPPRDIFDPAASGTRFDLTPDGSVVAAQSKGHVAIWNTASGALVATHALGGRCCEFSPGGRRLCVWSENDITIFSALGTPCTDGLRRLSHSQHHVLFNADESIAVAVETERDGGSIVHLDDGLEAAFRIPNIPGGWLHGSLCFLPDHPDRMCVLHQLMITVLQLPPRDDPDWRRRLVTPTILRSKTVELPTSWRQIGRFGGDCVLPLDAPWCTWRWGRVAASADDVAPTAMLFVYGDTALVTNSELETVTVVQMGNGAVDVGRYALLMGADPEFGEAPRCASHVYRVAQLPQLPQRVLAPLVEPAVLPAEVVEMHVATWLSPLSFGGVVQAA